MSTHLLCDTVSDDDDESSFNDDSTVGSNEGKKEDATERVRSKKSSRKSNSIPWNEIPLEQEGLESLMDRVDHERLVRYRKTAEMVKGWLDTVDNLDLPPNPLDRLLNELGGPDKVAELTGRKMRQVETYCPMKDKKKVDFVKRKGDGPMDQINIEEKK